MSEAAISGLVERVREEAKKAADLRLAFQQVLARLDVEPDQLDAWRDGSDIVGTAYERLFPGASRRDLGQFYTPFWAGEVMAGWVFEQKIDLLLDPGVGSGALSIAASKHRRRGDARMLGLDVDPLAVTMAKANRDLREIPDWELRRADFLLDVLEEQPDGVTCNPPYSRHHAIPVEVKARVHDGFEQRLGLKLSRLAGLHVLFLVRALEASAPGARLAFITPSDWLDVGYGRQVKEHLLDQAHIAALVFIEPEHLFFDGVLTTAVITLIEKGAPRGKTRVLRLGKELPRPAQVVAAVAGRGKLPVETVKLKAEAKWARPKARQSSGVRIGDVARIRRGIATGANSFFVISEAERRKVGIDRKLLRPCLTSPKMIEGQELTMEDLDALPDDVPRWLVGSDDQRVEEEQTPLGRYLRRGRRAGIHRGYLTSRRRPWYSQEPRDECPILFSYFNRDRPRFIRNRAGAVALNNWLIIEPREGQDADELWQLLSGPNTYKRLLEQRRIYGSGLWKLEPSELENVRLTLAKS